MMVLMAIVTVLSLLNVLSFSAVGIVTGLVYGAVYGYIFIVLYSLFSLFRGEYERGKIGQYFQPNAKV